MTQRKRRPLGRLGGLSALIGVTVLIGPTSAREFGEHERPWATDLQSSAALPAECPSPSALAAAGMVRTGLAPALDAPFEAGDRALALAKARNARLDAQQASIDAAKAELDDAAADLQEQMRTLQTLRASVLMEIDRLQAAETAAETHRIDLLRASRPRRAAAMIEEASLTEKARLLGALQPREAAAILAEFPEEEANAVFDAMRAGAPPPDEEDSAIR